MLWLGATVQMLPFVLQDGNTKLKGDKRDPVCE